jgi:hypothetical protein
MILPLLLVVLSVTQNASDVHHSPSVFDGGNQPAFVVAYIEDDEAPDMSRICFYCRHRDPTRRRKQAARRFGVDWVEAS